MLGAAGNDVRASGKKPLLSLQLFADNPSALLTILRLRFPATDYSPLSATVNSANVRTSANVLAVMARARAATKTIFAIALSLSKPSSPVCRKARLIAVTGITICRVIPSVGGLPQREG
jgi:hypothetical protein